MKRFATFMMLAVVLMAFSSPVFAATKSLQAEPAIQTKMEWYTEPNGMLTVGYDLDRNGIADYFTVRVVVAKFFSPEPVGRVERFHEDYPVFYVAFGEVNYYYVAEKDPLFYGYDIDEDGRWDLLFHDVLEDGVNGNEVLYASPSGMFNVS